MSTCQDCFALPPPMVTIDSDKWPWPCQSLSSKPLKYQPDLTSSFIIFQNFRFIHIGQGGRAGFSWYWISALHWEAQHPLERDPKMASQSSQEEVMSLWQKAFKTSEFELSFRSNCSLQVGDARFAELLKPIKDLTQNWQVLALKFLCNRKLYFSP